MKKVFILLLILTLCAGCTRITDLENYDIVINDIINNDKNIVNTTSMGYKYYLPLGVEKVYDKDFNQKFKIDDVYMYLYVDVVSYYYKNKLNFNDVNTDSYYYKELNINGKSGYIKVTLEDDLYFIKIVYNYAKLESYVSKTKLNNVLTNSMVILNSIDYNDNLIENILEDDYFSSVDKEYEIDKPDDAESKFSEYLSEYVQEEEVVVPDLPEY